MYVGCIWQHNKEEDFIPQTNLVRYEYTVNNTAFYCFFYRIEITN
jgi:hypothetical protein